MFEAVSLFGNMRLRFYIGSTKGQFVCVASVEARRLALETKGLIAQCDLLLAMIV